MVTIRRGIAVAGPPLLAGSMESSNGSAIATPAPRKKVRRDKVERFGDNGVMFASFSPIFGLDHRENGSCGYSSLIANNSPSESWTIFREMQP
jgi:hypothetical protein